MNGRLMKFSMILGLLGGVAGCSHTQSVTKAEEPQPAAAAEPAPAPEPEVQPAAAPAPVEVKTEPLYFDFDQYQLKPEAQEFLSSFGPFLAKYPELKVRIEGNCDERGTIAYNMALGAKRAEAAKDYLVQMGASPDQITTISYGKERPKAMGHDEAAWAENRRDDIVPNQTTVSANP